MLERSERRSAAVTPVRLGVVASHVIQYQAPLWAELAARDALSLDVYFLSHDGARPYYDRQFGQIVQWDLDLLTGYRHHFLPGAALPRLLRLIAAVRRSDVLVVHGYNRPWMLVAAVVSVLLRRPLLLRGEAWVETRQRGARAFARNALVRSLIRCATAGLAIGARNAAFYRHFGATSVVLAPYSVDTARFRQAAEQDRATRRASLRDLGLSPDLPTVVFVGKLLAKKRPLDLLEAVRRLETQVNVLVIGDGPLMDAAVAAAKSLKCRFLGFVNQARLPEVVALGDVLVLPSDDEPWGLVVNEAMAAGLMPVVSDRVGCAPDLVDGVGEVFAAGDVGDLVSALHRALARLDTETWRADAAARLASHSVKETANGFERAAVEAARRSRR